MPLAQAGPTTDNGQRTTDQGHRYDLLTAVLHEMGHVLGYEDLDPARSPDALMAGSLQPGERRLPVGQESGIRSQASGARGQESDARRTKDEAKDQGRMTKDQ